MDIPLAPTNSPDLSPAFPTLTESKTKFGREDQSNL